MDAFSQVNVMHYNEVIRVVPDLFHLKKISLPSETRLVKSTREKKEEAGKTTFALNATDSSVSSVPQSCPTLCDPMNHSTPGLPVHHHLPEFTQTHDHRVGDAIQPSHPLLSPSHSAPKFSHYQTFFQWVNSSHKVAKKWSFSFNIISSKEHPGLISFRMDWESKGLSRVFYNTTVQKHQFFGTQLSSQSNSHIHTWPQEKP